jgi:hypothetical protein
MRAAVVVDQVQRITREIVGMAAGFALDEVGILISCGEGSVNNPGIEATSNLLSGLTCNLPDQI